MPGFNIKRIKSDEDGAVLGGDCDLDKVEVLTPEIIDAVAVDGGMESGFASLIFRLDHPDGRTTVVRTSAGAILMLAAALRGWYGDRGDGQMVYRESR